MIIRDAKGNSVVVSDSYLPMIREGRTSEITSQLEKIPAEKFKEITEQRSPVKQTPVGSLLEGTSPFRSHDDTDMNYRDKKEIRHLLLTNPFTYNYLMDMPREAIYSPQPLNIVPKKGQTSMEGVEAVEAWRQLFEARRGQANLMYLSMWSAFYNRQSGEVLAEIGYLKNDYLHLIGYPQNEMIGRISMINPLLLQDIQYDNETGNPNSLTLPNRKGIMKVRKGKTLRNFIYFHNLPDNERRGVTRLRPAKRWIEGDDDLFEMAQDIYYNDARPIEHHTLDEDGLTWQEIQDMKNEHKQNIKNSMNEHQRMIMTSGRIDIDLLGMANRALDPSPILDRSKSRIHQSLRQPASFVEAKNANKATIDIQDKHYKTSQLIANDQATALRLLDHVFSRVLVTRGVDPRLSPTVAFVPFTSSNELEQSLTWQLQIDMFGYSRAIQIAEQYGFAYDKVQPVNNGNSTAAQMVGKIMDHNYNDNGGK